MRRKITGVMAFGLFIMMGIGLMAPHLVVYADDDTNTESSETGNEESSENQKTGTNISLTPVSKVLQISSNSVYEDDFTVTNDGDEDMEIEVYTAPYSYVYSSDEDTYKLGFNNDNNFTQISRWITFQNIHGGYDKKTNYTIPPHDSITVHYKISTPDNIPAGGQYAVMFAHTLTGVVSANGIKTEASPGIVVYGRSTEGEVLLEAEISDLQLGYGYTENGNTVDNFRATAKVKNMGNVDFNASGVLKIEPILWGSSYETSGNDGRISVIPESELVLSDEWDDSPSFGLYKATWTVTVGEKTEVIERVIFVNPLPLIIVTILVLTIIIICVIIGIKRRKERRSRLAV